MNKKRLFISTIVLSFGILYALIITQDSEIEKLQNTHAIFLKNHPYTKTLALTKAERKSQGLPPDKYFEQEYLNEKLSNFINLYFLLLDETFAFVYFGKHL